MEGNTKRSSIYVHENGCTWHKNTIENFRACTSRSMCLNTSEWFLWKRKVGRKDQRKQNIWERSGFRPTMTGCPELWRILNSVMERKRMWNVEEESFPFQDLPCVNGCLWKPFLAQLLVPGCKPALRQLAPSCSSRAFVWGPSFGTFARDTCLHLEYRV